MHKENISVCLPHQNITHHFKDGVLESIFADIVPQEGIEPVTHSLIIFSLFHCKQLWDFQIKQVQHQVSSSSINTVTFRHTLEKVQEVVVVLCTTEPGSVLYLEKRWKGWIIVTCVSRLALCL